MLEEVSMDKKTGNRSVQGPAKGIGTESKKNQDVQPNGKQVPRGCRQRESSGSSNGYKNEQNRKPAPQKNKSMDKRPRPRGAYNGGGKENTQISDDQMKGEYGSLFSGGSKKQNLNHLLNFHYEPRGEAVPASRQYHLKQNNYSTKALMATQTHKYNKEQFLQANCQFVVRSGVDYAPYMADPDLLVDWDYVELIRVWSNEVITCPICLYPPVAGKITRCGHIFCWSCILHYLALSDKTWRKCPICYESVHKKDLKSVEGINCSTYSVGQNITLQLMKREKGTLIATPVGQYDSRLSMPLLHISEQNLDTVYSKLLLAQYEDVIRIIEREQKELSEQLEENRGCPELCFVEEAVELLLLRKSQLESNKQDFFKSQQVTEPVPEGETSLEESQSQNVVGPPELATTPEEPTAKDDRMRYDSLSSESEDTNIRAEDLYIGTNQNQPDSQPVKHFYFYQAIDGQQVYLHAINVRMLEMNYGSLEHCPITINGVVLEKESGSMTSELRRRLRYMQHVPITCQFEVIEISLPPSLLTEQTMESFHEQLEQRKRRRAKQAREERKREKRIEESERRMFGQGPIPNLKIESLQHFPQCGTVDFPPCLPQQVPSGDLSRGSSPLVNVTAMADLSIDEEPIGISPSDDGGPSFAQMLREGKTYRSGMGWPSIGGGGKSPTPTGGSCWGNPPNQRAGFPNPVQTGDSDTEAYYAPSNPSVPSFNIAEALLNASTSSSQSGVGKKKKKKRMILLST